MLKGRNVHSKMCGLSTMTPTTKAPQDASTNVSLAFSRDSMVADIQIKPERTD